MKQHLTVGLVVVGIAILFGGIIVENKRKEERKTRIKERTSIVFNPKFCHRNNEGDFIYLKVNKYVFRVDPNIKFFSSDFTVLHFMERVELMENESELSINSSAIQEGCYENPIKVKYFHLPGYRLIDSNFSRRSEQNRMEWNRLSKTKSVKCERDSDFFIACRDFARPQTDPIAEWEAVYKADEFFYKTADGNSFIIYCNFSGGSGCNFSYEILDGVEVWRSFIRSDPTSSRYDNDSPYAIPIASIIDLDKKLRNEVRSMVVFDYPNTLGSKKVNEPQK